MEERHISRSQTLLSLAIASLFHILVSSIISTLPSSSSATKSKPGISYPLESAESSESFQSSKSLESFESGEASLARLRGRARDVTPRFLTVPLLGQQGVVLHSSPTQLHPFPSFLRSTSRRTQGEKDSELPVSRLPRGGW
jgi:hypothetical protein